MKKIFLIAVLAIICLSSSLVGTVYAETDPSVSRVIKRDLLPDEEKNDQFTIIDRRRRYEAAQILYQQDVETYRTHKAKLIEARERYQTIKNEEEKERFALQARVYLKSAIETFIHRAQRIVVWVDGNSDIDVQIQEDTIQKINAQITELNGMLASVDSLSLEQIQDLTIQVRARIAAYNGTVRSVVGNIKQAQIDTLWSKAQELLARFLNNIENMEDKGIDMTKARELLISANAKLSGEKTKENIISAYSDLRNLLVHLKQATQLQQNQN
ncbi:MAG: hypothetical protein HYV41_05130 [Candidatus Magasanikbacteria bacterium]|nr:hypothetical protein [Candidatus Magasanikbacteria bacterium]